MNFEKNLTFLSKCFYSSFCYLPFIFSSFSFWGGQGLIMLLSSPWTHFVAHSLQFPGLGLLSSSMDDVCHGWHATDLLWATLLFHSSLFTKKTSIFIIIIFKLVYMCVGVGRRVDLLFLIASVCRDWEVGIRLSGAGVSGSCDLSAVYAGNQI